MIAIQKRLFLTDQSKKEGKEFEPLRPTSEEEFIALSNSEEFLKRAQKVEALADDWWAEPDKATKKAKHDKMQTKKRSLLEIAVFQGTAPDDEHRQQASIVLNGLYSADFDGIDDVEAVVRQWTDLWPVLDPAKHPLSRMAEELGLVYIGDSISKHGIRIVGKAQLDLDLWDNQLWLAKQLQLEASQDGQCKDSSRASYCVPFKNIRYYSPELFTYNNKEYEEKWGPVYRHDGSSHKSSTNTPQAVVVQPDDSTVAETSTVDEAKKSYLGIPISEYIDMYWQLFYHGHTPSEGARDSLTFELACHIRHICGFDRDVLDAVIPCYDGFPEREKLAKIDSALREERKQMPLRMRQVLDAVSRQHQGNTDLERAVDQAAEDHSIDTYNRVHKALPFGVKDAQENVQPQMGMACLTPQFPIIGGLATHVRLDIHNEGFKHLNLQGYLTGKAASNKQQITEIYHLWTELLEEEDKVNRRLEEEHEALMHKKKNAKEQPEEKHFPLRLQASVTSITQILYRLKNVEGQHLISYTEESDVMAKRLGPAWSDMSTLLRAAYDNSGYSQDFRSESSVRVWLDKVLWNVVLCGTQDALFRMYKNYTDGSLTRVLIESTPDNTYSPLVIRKSRSEKSRQNIHELIQLLPLMQGDLVLPKLELRCQQWLERVRLETMKDDDRVRANQRMRIGVSVMRCICCLMLCDFGGFLIREIDRKKDAKPDWADGAETAVEYLQQHPKATEYWLKRKFQKPQLLDLFDTLADHYMDNVLYYFRGRIEKAYNSQQDAIVSVRRTKGRNDSYYDQLQEKFTLRQAMLLRDDDPDGNRTRSMLKNWTRQGLIRNIGVGEYKKV